ncbi:MAG: hypothetical protein KAT34_17755 [Candidatus Aminicenantes bacterium]|nr:hypothetical protein [Candidatus Aminicenantes bacterium]
MNNVRFFKKLFVPGGILLLLLAFLAASNPSFAQQAVKRPMVKPGVKLFKNDLTIKIVTCPKKEVKAGESLGASFQVTAGSTFASPLKDIAIDIILTSKPSYPAPAPDAVYSPNYANNVMLKGGREHISFTGTGKVNVKLNGTNIIPTDTPPGDYFLGAVIDAGNKVREVDERNNVFFCKLRIREAGNGGGPVTGPCCALPFSEWDGFTYDVEFVAAHSGIAVISAGNASSDPRAADVQITIDKDNAGTDIRTYRDYTGHTMTPDKYWSTVTVPFKKGDGVTITPNKYTSVHARVYYFAD